ncbi:MAG: STAS domain-containing protein [Candidatus Tectomicrobia bacterium]|uniref:STAS domain-containing protein n=1 Tax=Tectimicrobiota bacterium TaxID=2528274 RepID=A0A937W6P0_UNCTE|nr:STAS domain-containing protein [Candidatus Tectomicrobia bacterium]
MALATRTSPDGRMVTIDISGRFDFSVHSEFRKVYEQVPGAAQYVIDLRQTEYVESSALGMLLLLREHAGGDRAQVKIVHCRPEVKKILTIANFHQLFQLD